MMIPGDEERRNAAFARFKDAFERGRRTTFRATLHVNLPFHLEVPRSVTLDRDGKPEDFEPDFELAGRIAAALGGELREPLDPDAWTVRWTIVKSSAAE